MHRVAHVLYSHAAGRCTRRRTASPHDTGHAYAPDDDAEQRLASSNPTPSTPCQPRRRRCRPCPNQPMKR
jgi:hypothetical protein